MASLESKLARAEKEAEKLIGDLNAPRDYSLYQAVRASMGFDVGPPEVVLGPGQMTIQQLIESQAARARAAWEQLTGKLWPYTHES